MDKDMKANETQIGGDHYKGKKIEPWDFIIANNIPFMEGNIIRYIVRWRDKKGVEDLLKAKHYIEKLIETEQSSQIVTTTEAPIQAASAAPEKPSETLLSDIQYLLSEASLQCPSCGRVLPHSLISKCHRKLPLEREQAALQKLSTKSD